MEAYLAKLDDASQAERWPLVRGWLRSEPLALFSELRRSRPVLELPEVTLVSRSEDCRTVLLRHDAFSVALYEPKQSPYWMAQDDTPDHWRDKAVMRAVLRREDVPAMRAFAARETARVLARATGCIDLVGSVGRAIPIALARRWFGFADASDAELFAWSRWNQVDAFHNQPFDDAPDSARIVAWREGANARMRDFLAEALSKRASTPERPESDLDVVDRLLRLQRSRAVDFDLGRVVLNLGGLLIGTVETISQAAVQCVAHLLRDASLLAAARAAALAGGDAFDGYVFEALRFSPVSPYLFRRCETAIELARGTCRPHRVTTGTTVLALTQSAMFDEDAQVHPERFDPSRSPVPALHFGLGLHECLGRSIAEAVLPEMVRQCVLLRDVHALGTVDRRGGPVPESFRIGWTAATTPLDAGPRRPTASACMGATT